MDYLVEDLTPLAAHHTLLFYDQRGAGRSSLVGDSAALDGQRFAEDLEAVRQHFGLQRVTLLGHSWGAGVAALYASHYPGRIGRLLIVDGIPLRRQELTRAFQELAAARDSITRRKMQEWMAARRANPADVEACRAYYVLWFGPFFADSSAMRRSRGDFCAGSAESRRNKMTSVDRYVAASLGDWDWRPALRHVQAPALVIHGSADVLPVASARDWAAAVPGARLLLLQGIGHFPYLEAPDTFFGAVHEFLQGAWPRDAKRVGVSVEQSQPQ
jgi:proline iminopeptidase